MAYKINPIHPAKYDTSKMVYGLKGKRLIGHAITEDYYEDTKGNLYSFDGIKLKKLTSQEEEYTAKLYVIGQKNDLEGTELNTYVKFMKQRFPNERHEPYMDEWARRFKNKTEWIYADSISRETLKKVNQAKYYNYK